MTKQEQRINNGDERVKDVVSEIRSYIEDAEKDSLLRKEKNFVQRIDVIDFIGFEIIDQLKTLLQKADQPDQLLSLKYRAEKLKSELEAIDIKLFQKLRANIRAGKYTGNQFKGLINAYTGFNLKDKEHQQEAGYDNLDIFINGIFPVQAMPEQTKELEPEMVFYQKTPARIVFELVDKCNFTKEDVFFDLGSGLGQVAILVNLLTGITVKGVEFEPAFFDYAKDCAIELNLSNVEFVNVDARKADYSGGTIFFMYTPFTGEILNEVLEHLRKESLLRKIKIITYGPCTPLVATQNWLEGLPNDNIYKLAVFASL